MTQETPKKLTVLKFVSARKAEFIVTEELYDYCFKRLKRKSKRKRILKKQMNRAMRNLMMLALYGLAAGQTTIKVDQDEIASRFEKKSLLPKEGGVDTNETGTQQAEASTLLEGQDQLRGEV